MGESEKVEFPCLATCFPSELDYLALFLGQFQSEFLQPFLECFIEAIGVFFLFEAEY